MPIIDLMCGLVFCMYFYDTGRHNIPHIHIKYGDYELIVDITTCTEIEGYLPNKQRKAALQHIQKNKKKLSQMWNLAVNGSNPGKI